MRVWSRRTIIIRRVAIASCTITILLVLIIAVLRFLGVGGLELAWYGVGASFLVALCSSLVHAVSCIKDIRNWLEQRKARRS